MTGYTYEWRKDREFKGRKFWSWRLRCLDPACAWAGVWVEQYRGPAKRSKAAVAAFNDHTGVEHGGNASSRDTRGSEARR